MYVYLSELQLIEHLEVYLLNKISREIDGADSGNGTKGSTTHVVDLIVTQIQPSKKTHATESVWIKFPNLIVAQIQNLQDGISGKGSSKTKAILDMLRKFYYSYYFFSSISTFLNRR